MVVDEERMNQGPWLLGVFDSALILLIVRKGTQLVKTCATCPQSFFAETIRG